MSDPNNPRRAFVRAALASLGALAMSDSNAGLFGLGETKPPYPVKSSGLLFGRGVGNLEPIYWLDNDRAMFGAYAHLHAKEPGDNKPSTSPFGIYIWNVKDNTYTRYADLLDAPRLFQYDHGEIAYATGVKDAGYSVFDAMVGKMGEEKRITLSHGFANHPELEPSMGPRLTARKEANGTWTALAALRPEDGYIVIGTGPTGHTVNRENWNASVRYCRRGHEQPVELPILAKEMDFSAKLSYSDYLGKYVLRPHTWRGQTSTSEMSWPKDQPYPIYLISPEGEVETISIPAGPWYPGAVFPTTEGLFWVSNTTRGNSKDAGGWIVKDGKVTRLFDQLVDGAGVSPDGCTIVYANNDFNPQTTEYVQAIDLCAAQNKK